MRQTKRKNLLRCGLLVSFFFAMRPVLGLETLRVLAWPGYADPDVVARFEQRYQAKVEVTYVDSDEVLWSRLHSPQDQRFDVVAANTVEIARYVAAGLLAPLDLAALPNTRRQSPRFQALATIPGLVHDGRIYAVPYTYSTMGLIYDRRQFRTPPQSMNVLWNPRYRHKVLAFNSAAHNFSFTALGLGIAHPFRLDREQMKHVTRRLVALRRNILTYYTLPEEATELFMEHKVALLFANYGTQQLAQLRQAGADVGYVLPREGALAWLDCWAMTRTAPRPALATAWINYMLDPGVGALLSRRQGLANTQSHPSAQESSATIVWLAPVEDIAQRESLWRRIVSGDRPERF
ncbi:extracellular solute-binding protein [Paludibacterium yongneupense]|uniref:extracellular solute-binding protein n=1 Tax=Paludibacterium yongneupense TaxID=400061 RepID=UPI000404105B|nr:extracellular solute-binding protein [Paludibacterium yongneupense]